MLGPDPGAGNKVAKKTRKSPVLVKHSREKNNTQINRLNI